jgi:hypothetical protein
LDYGIHGVSPLSIPFSQIVAGCIELQSLPAAKVRYLPRTDLRPLRCAKRNAPPGQAKKFKFGWAPRRVTFAAGQRQNQARAQLAFYYISIEDVPQGKTVRPWAAFVEHLCYRNGKELQKLFT